VSQTSGWTFGVLSLARRIGPLLLAVAALFAAWPAAVRGAPSEFFGVTPSLTPDASDIQLMAQAKVGNLRMPIGWEELEPSPGDYRFGDLDRVVAEAAAQGITLRPFVFGTPPWARDCRGIPDFYCGSVTPMRTVLGRQRWPLFLEHLVSRYGPNGSFWTDNGDAYSPPYTPIRAWEIWDEPNSAIFLRPHPTPDAYLDLLRPASMAIREADPTAKIILAGLFGTPPNGMTMWRFLDRLYRTKGARSLFDAIALHPYSPNIRGIRYQLERARRVLVQHRARRTPIYLSEFGWGSASGKSELFKGVKGQASILRAAFRYVLANRKRYRLKEADWFSWRDIPAGQAGPCVLCESFGLLDSNHGPKPSLRAFASFTGGA
jgi:polysaccharide biosynthesis protein PslG